MPPPHVLWALCCSCAVAAVSHTIRPVQRLLLAGDEGCERGTAALVILAVVAVLHGREALVRVCTGGTKRVEAQVGVCKVCSAQFQHSLKKTPGVEQAAVG